MPLVSGRDLKQDVLFRASENITGSSGWDSKVLDYLNRVYNALAMGSSEYLPEHVSDWWWMREKASLILEPIYQEGSVSVTQGNASIVFSDTIIADKTGWKFKVDDHPDIFTLSAHGAGNTTAVLDTVYTGPTGSKSYKLMKDTYTTSTSVAGLISPMIAYRDVSKIMGMSPERMDSLYPPYKLSPGTPEAFSLQGEQLVRFSHGGRIDGQSMKIDYTFKPLITSITDSTDSIPLVPIQFRHVLADMALVYLLIDKNDNRANSLITSSRAIATAMYNENKHRMAKLDETIGWIFPRSGSSNRRKHEGPLRTESGLIIG